MSNLALAWAELQKKAEAERNAGYSLALRVRSPEVRGFLAMLMPQAAPAILIEVPLALRPRTPSSFKTKAFDFTAGSFPGLPADRMGLALQLTDNAYQDLFALLCDEVLAAVEAATSAAEAIGKVGRCLERWRRFIERGRKGLSEEEVRGLVGELVVLARLARTRGPLEALRGWAAPRGAIRDFELSGLSIEVKTFQAATGAVLYINDPAQLDEGVGRQLYLAAVRVVTSDAGLTLPNLVDRVGEQFAEQREALDHLEEALAASGYMAIQAAGYTQAFVLGPLILHQVMGDFPRIKPTDVPPGVLGVRFALPISGLVRFVCDPVPVFGGPVATIEVTV